ncbi:hypothetical protein [Ancylobacter lacus]|uniref:hypothetical protein n=1 Tax=Ancylobacter lacus TaxID=2579970 RepID=UPI001BCFAAD5|nr:hypothetical protein [Ancylobacter lacus]MBS7538632.1 hypothetical protein [Ancylobacter lacus]
MDTGDNLTGRASEFGYKAKHEAESAARSTASVADRAMNEADERLDALEDEATGERRYSFHTLVAAGLAGYVVGRLFSH